MPLSGAACASVFEYCSLKKKEKKQEKKEEEESKKKKTNIPSETTRVARLMYDSSVEMENTRNAAVQ